ncbi:MAG: hypothetical protein K0Q55_107 [Verrucomicrobia bacterium]|nr:hypothetical protein [Verrucomicrobiota bacterium]
MGISRDFLHPRPNGPVLAIRYLMLNWTITFLLLALIAVILGFGFLAGVAAAIAKVLFVLFLVFLVISLFRSGKKA